MYHDKTVNNQLPANQHDRSPQAYVP
jgi:hypothetical protein